MAKPKPPVSAWVIEQRKLKGWKTPELSRRLKERGIRAEEGTVRTWEAGRKPDDDAIDEMERLFGVPAPRDEAAPEFGGLIAALNRVADRLEARPTEDLAAIVTATVEATVRVLAERGLLAAPDAPARRSGQRASSR